MDIQFQFFELELAAIALAVAGAVVIGLTLSAWGRAAAKIGGVLMLIGLALLLAVLSQLLGSLTPEALGLQLPAEPVREIDGAGALLLAVLISGFVYGAANLIV